MANNPIAELVRSLAHEDEPATIVAAVRLRRALEIDGVSIAGADLTRARLARSILRDVHADGAKLDQLEATGATFLFVQAVASSLRLATFDRCLVEQSDFSRANLERSTWRSASVFGTGFAGAALADVRLDDALFVECDFRGADLGTVNLGPRSTASGARFVRCDLREASLNDRELAGVSFVDCKLHGIHGRALVGNVQILRPDLSAAGDGTRIVSATDVLEQLERGWP